MKTKLILTLLVLVVVAVSAPVEAAETDTTVNVEVKQNGDAEWTVTNTVTLPSENERQAFDTMSENQTRLQEIASDTAGGFQSFADRASDEVSRDMSVSGASATADRSGDTGTITVTFTWSNFAEETNESAVVVSDVFQGGLSLDEGQTLVIEGPFTDVSTSNVGGEIREASVRWQGPVEVSEDVDITFSGAPAGGSSSGNGMPGFGLVVGLVGIVGSILLIRRRRTE